MMSEMSDPFPPGGAGDGGTVVVVTEAFYIVLREFGAGHVNKVTRLHPSRALADEEAARLCKSTGHRFYVLRTVGYVEQQDAPVRWVQVP